MRITDLPARNYGGDAELEARWARIDAGAECPVCWLRGNAERVVAGADPNFKLFRCAACSAEWMAP